MFKYIFYRIFTTYRDRWNDSTPELYAFCIVSLLQGLNLFCLYVLINFFLGIHVTIDKAVIALLMALLLAINYYRIFIQSNIGLLEKKWKKEDLKSKRRRGYLIISFIVITILGTVFIADFFGQNSTFRKVFSNL